MGVTDSGFSTFARVAEGHLRISCSACRRSIRQGEKYRTYGQELAGPYAAGPLPAAHHLDCEYPRGRSHGRFDRAEYERQGLAIRYREHLELAFSHVLPSPWADPRADAAKIRQHAVDDRALAVLLDAVDADFPELDGQFRG